ncbi:hypothetical protein DPMN_118971 [Dreissena polymorpha]|uniref:Nitrate/nitrite sensing protein domain-containing protein n=1 Tax=Dreissena polymorpha TaxID=45954 RepID=A0A9D4GHZ9_DREPO|nr:hypothetical protein DPMN_118971 [Dreissena polymorpha]
MFSVEISAVVHAMQIERGTTALYVSSNGDTFVRTRLPNCYRETDTAFDGLSKWVSIDSNAVFQVVYHDIVASQLFRILVRNNSIIVQ